MFHPTLFPMLIVLLLAFLLFGKPGRLSSTMEDLGKGIRNFRKGLSEGDAPATPGEPASEPPKQITDATTPAKTASSEKTGT